MLRRRQQSLRKNSENNMSSVEELRKALGGVHPLAANKVKDHLDPHTMAFVQNAPFAVMASSDEKGNCDASPKGGEPGFIRVLDDRTLLMPDFSGNRLFQSFENFESNAKAGFIFMIPGFDVTVRINGQVEPVDKSTIFDQANVGDSPLYSENSEIVQGLRIRIEEAYFHCPRSFEFADLWNTKRIRENKNRSITSLKR
jgi:PPOX class probable FMN-dependent enzyme